MRIFKFGLILTSGVTAVLCYLLWGMYLSLADTTDREMKRERLAVNIEHLNEMITLSAHMAAETSNPFWEELYRAKEKDLDEAITESAFLSLTEYEQNYASQTKKAYSKLIEMEDLAFSLVNSGRAQEASILLTGPEYERQKAIYSEDLRKMVQAMRDRISVAMASFRRRSCWVSVLALISLLVLYAGWMGVSILIRNHLEKRLKAEQALVEEKENLSVTLRSIGDGVITTDTDGRIVLLNRAAEELTGYSHENVVGKPLTSVFSIKRRRNDQKSQSPVETVLKTGRVCGLVNHAILIASDGTERMISSSEAPIRDAQSNIVGVVLVFRDVTHQYRFEEELLKVEKLESVGILAGGIAHDFNNILTAILGNLYLARMAAAKGKDVVPKLHEAEKAAERASTLTQQLLTFAKGGAPIKEISSVGERLVVWVTFALSGSNVKCQFSVSPALWDVAIDTGQIERVVNNLIINAQQAMPEGGTIIVSAKNFVHEPHEALPLAHGRYVKLSVQDFGCGIPEEMLDKIFDPYFTTKEKGSGLGLSASYAVIKHHNGLIKVRSRLGAGTTFDVYLPASYEKAQPSAVGPETPLQGKGHILLMDDDPNIRDLAGAMLAEMGYSVSLCCDGTEALEIYTKHQDNGEPFDAVIMDLTVPGGMGGKEAMQRLKEMDPEIKAVVSSGYSDDPVMADYGKYGFSGVLPKPYSSVAMSTTLRNIMNKRTRA
jgi:PAS domain S-box-containing protein